MSMAEDSFDNFDIEEEYEELIDALETSSILAGAKMARLCNQKKYTDALIFEAIRDTTRKMSRSVSQYQHFEEVDE